jgi:PKD repeat protein
VETFSSACTSSTPFTVTWAAPTITSFTPTGGPVGTLVNIYGTTFHNVTSVKFNGTPAVTYGANSETWIQAYVPLGATTGPISVTTSSGTDTSTSPFTVTGSAPTISSFTPTSGPVGASVDIQGTNFSGATGVQFNGTADPGFVVNSSTDITAHVPAGATTGPISVSTASGIGTSWSSFTVIVDAPPNAGFAVTSCSALTCYFDGSAASDPDGMIQVYKWDFGDGAVGTGVTPTHSYAYASAYTVTLTVTDNAGVTSTASHTVTLIALTAHGYKQQRVEKVDLSWNGPSGTSFDVYRNGGKIATVQAGAYTDNINSKGAGTYTYKVCTAAGPICSNTATVSF